VNGTLSGLTTRGRCLIAAGFAATLCAWVLNERDLLRVAVFVIALPVVVGVLTSMAKVALHARRTIAPIRVPVGDWAEVALAIRSSGRLPTGGLLLSDSVPHGLGGTPRFVVERLPRHSGTVLRYHVNPTLRGIQQIGPLKATITDPFGLAEYERELAHSTRIIVVPRVCPLVGVPGGSGLGSGDDGSVRLHSGQGEDDAVVRQYRQGDDLRKVHWRSTAKRDEMMVRVEERPWRGGTTVLLDHRIAAHRGGGATSSLEWAVSMAASICLHLHRYGHRIRLVTETGRVLSDDSGDGSHSDHVVLDALAGLQATHQRELRCSTDPGHGQELIAIVGAATAEEAGQLIRYRSRGARSLAVVLDAPAWGAGADNGHGADGVANVLRGAGWGVVVATPTMPMSQVWMNLCHTTNHRRGSMITGAGL